MVDRIDLIWVLASLAGCTLMVLRRKLTGNLSKPEILWLYMCALCVGYFDRGLLIWLGTRYDTYVTAIDYIGYIALATGFVSEKIVLFLENKVPDIMTSIVNQLFSTKQSNNE